MKKLLTMIALLAVLLLATTALAECHHTYDMIDVKKVTCETDGYYILKCNECGHTVKEITDKAPGHNWAFVTSVPETCDEDGYDKFVCKNCNEYLYETTEARGHKWKDSKVLEEATCTKDGSMRTVCEVCGLSGTRVIKKGHKYGEWTITEEATDHSKGTRTRTCRVCKKKQTEEYYPEGTLYKDIKGHSDEIKALQQKLTDLGYLNDKVDGKFGKKTQAAVKAFQKAQGLTADGIAWPQTLSALDAAWNAEFGVPEEAYAPCCGFLEIDENGKQYWETCEVHANICMHAADELPEDASEADIANAYAVAWQTELNRLYQLWLDNCEPEDQPMVVNHKVMFEGHLNSQIALWSAQYGEGSLMVLRLVNETMEEQCYTLCPVVYALTPAE